MIDIRTMVAELIEAGCAPDVAAKVVAGAFVAGANSTTFRGIPVDETAEKRRAYDRERKRKPAEIHRNSAESEEPPVSYRDTSIKKDKRQNSERASRGTRIDPTWTPSDADRLLARQEGFSESETTREALRFLDYWTSRAGSGGVKLDWAATWRNWVRTSGEKLGKTPSPGAKAASDEVDWDTVLKTYKTIGHWSKWAGPDPSSPACRVPSEMLEKYGMASTVEPVTAPRMRSMQ